MSYSIGPARGATKAAVLATLAMMYDERVLAHQPVHAHDKAAALKVAETQLNLVADLSADQEYAVTLNGWLSWVGDYPESHTIMGAGVGCSVTIVTNDAPA